MKIALFSDIHANLPALTAMFQSMENHKPDAIYCLGDLVGYHVYPNQVIAEIQKRGIATLAGNHDLKPVNFPQISAADLENSGVNYAYHIIDSAERAYLQTLPAYIRLNFQLPKQNINILLAHGSPKSVNEYILEDTDEAYVLEMMRSENADILCVGHSHLPYQRVLKNNDGVYKMVINTGSVGKPKDGNPQGGYVLLSLHEDTNLNQTTTLPKVDFIRFDYDLEQSTNAILNSPLPNELAERLKGAY